MTEDADRSNFDFMELALEQARHSPPQETAYCVGVVLVLHTGATISAGFTKELPGNTHAEQCCFQKASSIPDGLVLHTTVKPCTFGPSGNKLCADRILEILGIKTVYVGVKEPVVFVKGNEAEKWLQEGGEGHIYVPGLEKGILEVATRGHKSR